MNEDLVKRQAIDEEHLKLLAIFHYVFGGITIAFSLLFILQLVFMSVFFANPELFKDVKPDKLDMVQTIFKFGIVIFSLFILFGVAWGVATIYSGRCIQQRKYKLFSMIIAGINLISIPFGTILGVFTLIVLSRESVKGLYEGKDYQTPA